MIGTYYKYKQLGYKTLFVGNGAITMGKGNHHITILNNGKVI